MIGRVYSLFFFKISFLCGPFLKSFIEFVAILHLFYLLVFWPQGCWELTSLTRYRTPPPQHIGRWSLNWAAKEVLVQCILKK